MLNNSNITVLYNIVIFCYGGAVMKNFGKGKIIGCLVVAGTILGGALAINPIKTFINNKNALESNQYTILKKGKSINYIEAKGKVDSFPIYIFFMGIAVPIIIVTFVNYLIVSKQLNRTPLQLLRKEKKRKNQKDVDISILNFMVKFKILQLVREFKGNVMLFIGVVFAMFILILGLGMSSTVSSFVSHVGKDAVVDYTYILKIPIEVNENDEVEKSYIKGLTMYCDDFDTNMNVTVQGINKDSVFYDYKIDDNDKNAYVSSSFADKFHVRKGDSILLKDTQSNKIYSFNVGGIVDYRIGLYVFMNRQMMNESMNQKKSNYIVVIVLTSYYVSTLLLKRYINKISLSDALKNRE